MTPSITKHTVTAFYDRRDDAETAAAALRSSGVPASDVSVSPDSARDELGAHGTAAEPMKTGFWASLEEMFAGSDDRHAYAEGVRRGNIMLTAHVDDVHLDRAVEILEQHGSIDLAEHEETWRSEGWTGAPATSTALGGATGLAMAGRTAVDTGVTATPVAATSATKPAVASAAAVGLGTEEVLQVVEERLDVGKRAVSRGKVRLHSYVVENQVSEDVTLRDETVTIDRHAVDRPVAALGADAFRERTIEVEEVDEEAVVAKSARVVEEIGIRKDAAERTETIRDTVRSTKVDIEDGRTVGTAATGLTGGFASRLVADMEVVGSDGMHVGTIDRVEGATMKLKRSDPGSGGQHHRLPVDLVESVDRKATLAVTAADAMKRWTAA